MAENQTKYLPNEATRQFVREHADADVRQLALHNAGKKAVNLPLALDQIAGRQYARHKLPIWSQVDDIVYPPHLSLEQCSSEATARYKAKILNDCTLVDLTGGMGVDCYFMAQSFDNAVYVECQPHLCEIAKHNFHLLDCDKIKVVNSDAEEYLHNMKPVDLIFIDPARRDNAGRRTYGIEDCTPDVAQLAPELLAKAHTVMIKLSPMLDVTQVLNTLPHVTDIHIVSVTGECKELLVLMSANSAGGTQIHCVNDDEVFTYQQGQDNVNANIWDGQSHKSLYVYEPNASIMKAGCFSILAARNNMQVMSHDSHLLVSDKYVDKFPGRAFMVDAISSMNKGELKQALGGITQANVAVRNFPMRADELARRLHLKDGGKTYIFGTTTASGHHVILICKKVNN
ncbi:MAG: SAM-dependent methyltransferase [Muribaculaceae bacterium]|nr:SAM-dependent methyltransferase [Muribaculaceae bacterium]